MKYRIIKEKLGPLSLYYPQCYDERSRAWVYYEYWDGFYDKTEYFYTKRGAIIFLKGQIAKKDTENAVQVVWQSEDS